MKPFSLISTAIVLSAASAFAAPPAPDLQLTLTPPTSAHVYESAGYNLRVRNIGNKDAAGVKLTIQLPKTQTSPNVYVMGTLGAYSTPACTRTGTTLVCQLGVVAKAANASVFFDLALPYSTSPLVLSATATTTTTPETNPSNNTVNYTANPLTYPATVTPDVTAVNRHCTGQPTLSSYFECALFPSSISSHQTIFNADNTITFVGAGGAYTGTWTYTPSANRLQFEYFSGADKVAEFDGRGVSSQCFEGKTLFPSNPNYVSLYQVCFP